MQCITIKQPYASAIVVLGEKTVENRTWITRHRGPLLIHAGKSKSDLSIYDWSDMLPGVDVKSLPRGVILGTVELVDCVEFDDDQHGDNPWACGPYLFVLENPKPFKKPIPLVGKLGIYPVTDDLLP